MGSNGDRLGGGEGWMMSIMGLDFLGFGLIPGDVREGFVGGLGVRWGGMESCARGTIELLGGNRGLNWRGLGVGSRVWGC